MMPDIKTEMSKVLNAWDTDAQQTSKPVTATPSGRKLWAVTNNVTRATFDYVQNNGGQTGDKIRADLAAKGFKTSSVSSLLTQFINQGLIVRDVDGKYYAKVSEYATLKSSKRLKPTGKRKSKIVTSPRSTGIAALKPEPKLEPNKVKDPTIKPLTGVAPYVAMAWDAETVINNIGLKQAHALYKELGKYFNV
jgi:hypothetical protein